jgi:hypothetical protein
VTDLQTLGKPALPLIAEAVPRLPAPALLAAAQVLGKAGLRSAAPSLAARLLDPPQAVRGSVEPWDPAGSLLEAIEPLMGPDQVGPIASLMQDETRESDTRLRAFTVLAGIGSPAAVTTLERALSRPRPVQSWWRPPTPDAFLQYIGRSDLEALKDEASNRQDWKGWALLEEASNSVRLPRPDGSAAVVFHDSRLGGARDLWWADVDSGGHSSSSSRFLGGVTGDAIRASLDEAGALVVERTDPPGTLRFEAADFTRDTDGDGVPDVVEHRLGTRSDGRDTDGDGLDDAVDAAPTGAAQPQSEEEEIVHAIFEQFFLFDANSTTIEIAIVAGESPLQWSGRDGWTLTFTKAQSDQFMEEGGQDGVAHISIEPGQQLIEEDAPLADVAARLGPDEREYRLTSFRGGLNAAGYSIVVRRLNGRWVMKKCEMAWIS